MQYYEKVDDSVNAAQVKEKCDALLSLKNRVVRTLTNVKILGNKSIRAGNMIFVNLPKHDIKGFLLCTKAEHTYQNAAHTVNADFKLID